MGLVSDERPGGPSGTGEGSTGEPASADRTMQVDALVEDVADGYGDAPGDPGTESDPGLAAGPPVMSARPPPLPKKKSKAPMIVLAVVVAVVAIGAAVVVGNLVMGGPDTRAVAPAPRPTAPSTPAVAATPAAEPPAAPAEPTEPRQIMLDDEF